MSKARKLFAMALCMVLMACAFAGCNSAESTATPSAAADSETNTAASDSTQTTETTGGKKRVFFTNAFNTAPFCAPLNAAALQKAEELGIELQIEDGQADANVQLEQINNAITQGYDGIIYFPADKESSVSVVKRLNESGVPYIVIDSQVDDSVQDTVPCFVGPDNIYMGEVAGNACVELLGGAGSATGNIVILEGAAGTDPARNRQQGFLNIVEKEDGLNILASQNVDGWDPAKAMTIMQDYITRFGDDIDFIYTHDDGIFQGVSQALEQSGMSTENIKAVSTGANNVGCAAIDAGTLYGSVLHSAKEEGELGVQAIFDVMNGQQVETWMKCSSPLVTKENIEEWRGMGW